MGASDSLETDKQESFASSRQADEHASSKVSSDDCLTKRKSDSSSAVHCPDFVDDVLPKQSPNSNELLPCSVAGKSVKPKQHSHCLQNNITRIVTIVLTIFIKLLLLLDVLVSTIFAVNGESTSLQNKRARIHSDAGSPDCPLKNSLPVCFYELLKNEDPKVLQVTAAEKEVEINTVDILDHEDVVVTKAVLNDIVLKTKIDPDTSLQSSLSKENVELSDVQIQCESSVLSRLDTVSGHAKSTEVRLPQVCQKDKTIRIPGDNAISDATTDTIDTICFPFVAGCSTIPNSIEGYEFRCLVDTGAAITAVSANVWNKYLRHVCPSLDDSALENITSVNGGILKTLGKTMMHFVIQSEVFPFEAYVIKNLTYDVILGRDFLHKFSSKIDFKKGRIKFLSEEDPLPFHGMGDTVSNNYTVSDDNDFNCSVHADFLLLFHHNQKL